MDDLQYQTNQRGGGPRGAIKGARLSIGGKTRESLRIALCEDAAVEDAVSVAYSAKSRVLVIDKVRPDASRLLVRRDASEGRTSYPVILVSMKGETPIKFRTEHAGTIDCELRQLDDGRLVIPVPSQFEHIAGGAR